MGSRILTIIISVIVEKFLGVAVKAAGDFYTWSKYKISLLWSKKEVEELKDVQQKGSHDEQAQKSADLFKP